MNRKCNIPKNSCTARKNGYCLLGIECLPIIDKCEGCAKIENGYCKMYINPAAKWKLGICPGATHVKKETKEERRRRLGQQKQKRMRR